MNKKQFGIELAKVAAKPGMNVIYNDGRPGHTAAKAVILSSDDAGMTVQFSDRADTSRIRFDDDAWMKFITFSRI